MADAAEWSKTALSARTSVWLSAGPMRSSPARPAMTNDGHEQTLPSSSIRARHHSMMHRIVPALGVFALSSCDIRAWTLPACRATPAYVNGVSALAGADAEIASGDFQRADKMLARAIEALGYRY